MRKTLASFFSGAAVFCTIWLAQAVAVPMNLSTTPSAALFSSSSTDGSLSPRKLEKPAADSTLFKNVDTLTGFTPSSPYMLPTEQRSESDKESRILHERWVKSKDHTIRKFDANGNRFENTESSKVLPQISLKTRDQTYGLGSAGGSQDVTVVHHGNPNLSYEELLKSISPEQMLASGLTGPSSPTVGQELLFQKPLAGLNHYPKSIHAKLQHTDGPVKSYVDSETHHRIHHSGSSPSDGGSHVHIDQESHYSVTAAPVHNHAVKAETVHLPQKSFEAHAHFSLGHPHGHGGNHHHHGYGHHHHPHHHGDLLHHHHHLGHSLLPAIGKTLKFLLPPAFIVAGASALFPKRVHVPTNYVHSTESGIRKKRNAMEEEAVQGLRTRRFDVIPSDLLKKEHRAASEEDEGFELIESGEDYPETVGENYGDKMPSFGSEVKTLSSATPDIPKFVPMPTLSSLPVIKLNKMTPKPANSTSSKPDEGEDYLIVGEEVFPEVESQKIVPVSAKKNLGKISAQVKSGKPKLSPQDAMSQLLKATMTDSLPAVPTTIASEIKIAKSLTSLVLDQVTSKPKQEAVSDSQSESSDDKPIFRRLSTENPKVIIVTPEPKTGPQITGMGDLPDKVVSRRNAALPNITSVTIKDGPGPSLILLGGEANDTDNTIEKGPSKAGDEKSSNGTSVEDIDLSPDSPVVGLITNYAMREKDSPQCQKRALCELASRGSRGANATKFERFLWNLANLVPGSLSGYYDLEDTFQAIKERNCGRFRCLNPNLDLQEI